MNYMSNTYKDDKRKKSPYLRKRKMIPYAYTNDGHSPWKKDGGTSGEDSDKIGMNYKRNKQLRKRHQRENQIENKRARKFHKRIDFD